MNNDYLKIIESAKSRKKYYHNLIDKIKKSQTKDLDKILQKITTEVFKSIDCLDCANCCFALGPLFNNNDIERISGELKLSPKNFINEYLITDEDGDFIFKELPCPFLLKTNHCFIYDKRPKACKEYPHTEQKNSKKHLKLAKKNIEYCPALILILDAAEQILK